MPLPGTQYHETGVCQGQVHTVPYMTKSMKLSYWKRHILDITVLNFKNYFFDFFVNLEKTCEINWIWTPLGGKWKILNHLSPGGKPLGDEWKA